MIFVCVGSRSYQFNRLFKELDRLVAAGRVRNEVFAQIGASTYEPQYLAFEHFMDSDNFKAKMVEASIVISHGASGSIMGALSAGKCVIAVARLEKYGEHINDHQVGIIQSLASEGLVLAVEEMDRLGEAIEAMESGQVNLKPWKNEHPTAIIDVIDAFIQEEVL